MILAVAVVLLTTSFEVDLTQVSQSAALTAIRALPAGNGEFVRLQGFDGVQIFNREDGGRYFAAELGRLTEEAHQRGYRVLADWSVLNWNGISKTKAGERLLEYRASNAFARKAEYDFVSPASAPVRKCLRGYVAQLKAVAPKLDALAIHYALPRQPFFAHGIDTRSLSIDKFGLDPVDMNESPFGHQTEEVNQTLVDFMEWRLQASNAFLKDFVKQASSALPNTEFMFNADPGWLSRSSIEQGAALGDWVSVLESVPRCGLLLDTSLRTTSPDKQFEELSMSLESGRSKPKLWIRFPKTPDAKILDTIQKKAADRLEINFLIARKG